MIIYTHLHIYICTDIRIYVYVYTYIHIYIYTRLNVYIYTFLHTTKIVFSAIYRSIATISVAHYLYIYIYILGGGKLEGLVTNCWLHISGMSLGF